MPHRARWLAVLAGVLGTPLTAQDSTARASSTVQRDSLPWSIVIDSAAFHDLPVTDPRQVIDLQPGVIETGNAAGASLRGSDPGAAAIYVDGALIRNGQRGGTGLLLSTNAVAAAALSTGALGADVGDAGSGAISFFTRTGGERWRGSLHYRTDDVGVDLWGNVGLHMVEASLGGPVRGGLKVFTAVTLNGQQSLDTQQDRDTQAPVYVTNGIDTVVHQPDKWGAAGTDTELVAIPRFVKYSGTCAASGNSAVRCQGLRVPFTANGSYAWQGAVRQTYGHGSVLSLTGLVSQAQERNFPGVDLYNPSDYTGTTTGSSAWILGWNHRLGGNAAGPPMTLSASLSYQVDVRTSGPLTRTSELDSRNPFGGFLLKPLGYVVAGDGTHSVKIKDSTYANVRYFDDRQLECIRAGEGACLDDVAYLNDNDLNSIMPYRMNPYGVEQSNLLPFWTAGTDNGLDLSREARWAGRAALEWRTAASNRVRVGTEYRSFDTERYSDPSGMNSSFGLSMYHERPVERGASFEDRFEGGGVTIVGGVRYDYYDSRARFPFTPGRISSFPQLPSDSICSPSGKCTVVPGASTPFEPYRPDARYVRASSHTAWSPHLQAAFRVASTTSVRLSYSQQTQAPPFDFVFSNENTDLASASRQALFGRDLDFSKMSVAEAGVRQALGADMTLDVAGYYKQLRSSVIVKLVQLPDPLQTTSTRNEYALGDFLVFANADEGEVRGLDGRLERRLSDHVSGAVAFTYESGLRPGPDVRSGIAGWVAVTLPQDWHHGTGLGTLLAGTSAFATFRATNGQPYQPMSPSQAGYTLDNPGGTISSLQTARLPWTKTVDLRLRRGLTVGHRDGFVFLESTNLLNWTNIRNLFTEVGDVVYPGYEHRYLNEQTSLLRQEAQSATILRPDSSVDFNALGVAPTGRGATTAGSRAGRWTA